MLKYGGMLVIKNDRCDLVLKQNTGDIPNDGKYYLYHKNKLVKKFSSLKESEKAFEEIEKQYPALEIDRTPANIVDILKNQLRTVSNNALLKGSRTPYKNPR